MSIEEIMAAMNALIERTANTTMTTEEVTEYENLETSLKGAQASEQIRSRNAAYNTVRIPAGVPTGRTNPLDGPSDQDKGFSAYLRTGQPNQDISGLRVRNEMGEGTSSSGGYTVPDTFRDKIVEVKKAFGGLAAEVDSFNTATGSPVEYPSMNDTANEGEITAEHAAVANGSDIVFDSVPLGAYKYTASGANNLPLRVSMELLQDSAFDIDGLVARAFATRIARKQAAHWTTGTGVGQPLGIAASSLTADNDLDANDVVDLDDLQDTEDLLDPSYEQNAIWVMRKSTWSAVRAILDTTGRPLIQGQNEGIDGRPNRTIFGYRVVIDQSMPALVSAGITFPIVFGDMREAYVTRRVADLAIVVNPWSRAANGQVEYTGWERADGNIQNRSAYVLVRSAA